MHRYAGGGGQKGREDVQGGLIEGTLTHEECLVGQMVVKLTLKAAGRGMQHQFGACEGALVGKKVGAVGIQECGEVVTKGAKEFWQMTCRAPR
jgi:hypothetical protein